MSDIDIVIFGTSKDVLETGSLYQLSSLLEENRITWPNGAKVITTAKVPIIKIQERKSLCFIDIAFGVTTGIENTKMIQNFVYKYPMLRPMTLVIKYYLKQNYLNDTWSGGIGSYTLVILIINFLQKEIKVDSRENLAELIIGFFQFYGIQFNYNELVISVKDNCYYNKKTLCRFNELFPDSLSLEDPCNPDIDLGTACFQIAKIRKLFEEAYHKLTTSLQQSCISYLSHSQIINPNFITKYRQHIKHLYNSNNEEEKSKLNTPFRKPQQYSPPQTRPSISFIHIHYKSKVKKPVTKFSSNTPNNKTNQPSTTTTTTSPTTLKPSNSSKIIMAEFPELLPTNCNSEKFKLEQHHCENIPTKVKKLSGKSAIHN